MRKSVIKKGEVWTIPVEIQNTEDDDGQVEIYALDKFGNRDYNCGYFYISADIFPYVETDSDVIEAYKPVKLSSGIAVVKKAASKKKGKKEHED